MKIIYKRTPKDRYLVIVEQLNSEFPERSFRVIWEDSEHWFGGIGIEERTGGLFWGTWTELDLEEMGFKNPNKT
jgi:hypothetical protein